MTDKFEWDNRDGDAAAVAKEIGAVLVLVHCGQFGVAETAQRVARSFFWIYLANEIEKHAAAVRWLGRNALTERYDQ